MAQPSDGLDGPLQPWELETIEGFNPFNHDGELYEDQSETSGDDDLVNFDGQAYQDQRETNEDDGPVNFDGQVYQNQSKPNASVASGSLNDQPRHYQPEPNAGVEPINHDTQVIQGTSSGYLCLIKNVGQYRQDLWDKQLLEPHLAWIEKIYDAIMNVENIGDKQLKNGQMCQAARRLKAGYYPPLEIERACWKVLVLTCDFHPGGLVPPHHSLKVDNSFKSTQARLDAIITNLRISKSMCKQLLDPEFIHRLIDNPSKELQAKENNIKINSTRDKQNHLGREVLRRGFISTDAGPVLGPEVAVVPKSKVQTPGTKSNRGKNLTSASRAKNGASDMKSTPAKRKRVSRAKKEGSDYDEDEDNVYEHEVKLKQTRSGGNRMVTYKENSELGHGQESSGSGFALPLKTPTKQEPVGGSYNDNQFSYTMYDSYSTPLPYNPYSTPLSYASGSANGQTQPGYDFSAIDPGLLNGYLNTPSIKPEYHQSDFQGVGEYTPKPLFSPVSQGQPYPSHPVRYSYPEARTLFPRQTPSMNNGQQSSLGERPFADAPSVRRVSSGKEASFDFGHNTLGRVQKSSTGQAASLDVPFPPTDDQLTTQQWSQQFAVENWNSNLDQNMRQHLEEQATEYLEEQTAELSSDEIFQLMDNYI